MKVGGLIQGLDPKAFQKEKEKLDPRVEEVEPVKDDQAQREALEAVEEEKKADAQKQTDDAQKEGEPARAEGEQSSEEKQKEEERKKKEENPEIEYDDEEVSVPNLFGIKLRVLMHPAFRNQGRFIARKGGSDAFILFYWSVIKHDKLVDSHEIRAFRNAVLQRSRPDRIQKAAEWVAQADPAEYKASDVVDFLTGKNRTLKSIWEKNAVDRGAEMEIDESVADYESWGQVKDQFHGYFPLVDFVQGDTAVSLKTVDPKNTDAVEQLKAHIEELARRQPMKDGKPLKLVLDLRLQGSDQRKLEELLALAEQHDIEVKVNRSA